MMTDRDDLLIQKCVDNEVTPDERRELIGRLENQPEGWKSLACSFMEDQLFAQATREALAAPVQTPIAPVTAAARRHWFNHPLTSLALSACVIFLAGVLVSREIEMRRDNQPAVVQNNLSAESSDSVASIDRQQSGRSDKYRQQHLQLVADGIPAQELPAFHQEDYVLMSRPHWKRLQQTMQSSGASDFEPKFTTIRFVNEDGRVYLIPVSGLPAFQ